MTTISSTIPYSLNKGWGQGKLAQYVYAVGHSMHIPTIHIPMQNWSRMLHFFLLNSFKKSYHPILWLCCDILHAALPRAQLSRAALLSPSRLTQIESFSFWFCSLAPSAPKMKARPLELPAMRPVSGVDKVSIKFFQQPIKMYRAKAIPRKNINTITTRKWHNKSINGKKPSHICPLHAELPIHMYNVLIYSLNCYSTQFISICFWYITTHYW